MFVRGTTRIYRQSRLTPYILQVDEFRTDRLKWPEIAYVDVLHFIVFLQESTYSKDQLKNYKSLDSYKLLQDVWIRQILHKEIDGTHLLRAKVAHSMCTREKPLEPWVIVSENGRIDSAHCTCMAGLGECCSHVAALLFVLETSSRINKESPVTDVQAYWMLPTSANFSAQYKRLRGTILESQAKKRKLSQNETRCVVQICYETKDNDITLPIKHEETVFLEELNRIMPNNAILSLTTIFSDNFQTTSLSVQWPGDLGALYDSVINDSELKYHQILDKYNAVYISLTTNKAIYIEKETRNQSNSVFWHKNKTGRITASNFHSACHTYVSQPYVSLVKTICSDEGIKKNRLCSYRLGSEKGGDI